VNVAGLEEIWLEAECSQVGSSWSIQTSADASGGEYLTPPSGFNGSPPTNSNAILSFTFSVTNPGIYKVYGLVKVPSTSDDSFYIRVNGGTWISWNSISGGNYFSWQQVHSSAIGPNYATYNLSAGTNTIEVGPREDGSGLDKLYLTKTGGTPIGFGGNASNCGVSLTTNIHTINDLNEAQVTTLSSDSTMIISPNPSKSYTTITINRTDLNISKIELYDLSGRFVRSFEISTAIYPKNSFEIDLTGIESGLYILHLLTAENQKIAESKLVIE